MRYLLPIMMFLGSCAQVESSSTAMSNRTDEPKAMSYDDVLATYVLEKTASGGPQPTFHAARMAGKLTVQNGCIGLTLAEKFMTLAFPPDDAIWDQQRRTLVVGGIDYALGTSIEVGGSTSGGPAVKELASSVPERCRLASIWYVAPGSLAAVD